MVEEERNDEHQNEQSPQVASGGVEGLVHDLRNVLGVVANSVFLAEQKVDPSISGPLKRGVKVMKEILDDAERSQLKFVKISELRSLLVAIVDELPDAVKGQLALSIEPLPVELNDRQTKACYAGWYRILKNLLPNAGRKGATRVVLSLRFASLASGHEAVEVHSQDDGIGMSPDVLKDVQSGKQVTDKSEGDGLQAGESVERHGHGLRNIRAFIEHPDLCGGEMHVESTQDPEHHGTTFRFLLPLKDSRHTEPPVDMVVTSEVVAEPPPSEAASEVVTPEVPAPEALPEPSPAAEVIPAPQLEQTVQQHRTWVRLSFLAAMGLSLVVVSGNSVRKPQVNGTSLSTESPDDMKLSADVQWNTDAGGGISKVILRLQNEYVEVGPNAPPHKSVGAIRSLERDGVKALCFHMNLADHQPHKVFLTHTPQGTFGMMRGLDGTTAPKYVLAPKDANHPEHILGVKDTVIVDGQLQAFSLDTLRSKRFHDMADSLRKLREVPVKDKTEEPWQHAIERSLQTLLALHQRVEKRMHEVGSEAELDRLLQEREQLLIATDEFTRHLLEKPLTPERIARLKETRNALCLPGVSVKQVAPLFPKP